MMAIDTPVELNFVQLPFFLGRVMVASVLPAADWPAISFPCLGAPAGGFPPGMGQHAGPGPVQRRAPRPNSRASCQRATQIQPPP